MSYLRLCILAAALPLSAPLRAQNSEPVLLAPEGGWTVNYADESCRLIRTFANRSDRAVFYLDQLEPTAPVDLVVAGTSLKGAGGSRVHLAFGPGGGERTIERALDAQLGDYGAAVIANGMAVVNNEAEQARAAEDLPKSFRDVFELAPAAPSPAEVRNITWLDIAVGERQRVRLQLGSLEKPVQALLTCTEELLTHWGIDVPAHRNLKQRPKPKNNPGSWLRPSDYPSDLVAKGAEGIVKFRLMVDETGQVSSCHVQQSTRPVGFDKAVCDSIGRRASFEPALDSDGRPIKSYWRSSARFIMP